MWPSGGKEGPAVGIRTLAARPDPLVCKIGEGREGEGENGFSRGGNPSPENNSAFASMHVA